MNNHLLKSKRNRNTWIKLFLIIFTIGLLSCQSVPSIVYATSLPSQSLPQTGTTPNASQEPQEQINAITKIYLPTIQNGEACGTNCYFFDSVHGSDSNSGHSSASPWKTLTKLNSTNFQPGDRVYFARGSSWTGAWVIDNSGTAEKPILFSSYGTDGPMPVFRNPGSISNLTNAIKIRADWVILENVKVQEAQLSGVYIDTGADYNVVRSIEATLTGEGVNVHGQHNLITANYIHDLIMVRNTSGGDDDYGAVGVWLFNHYNEVSYNQLINCIAPSYDYGEDGGAVEFYRDVNHSYIHHNYAYNTKGFTEIGGGTAYYNVISYNVMVNSGRPLGLHMGGGFASDIAYLYFENNTIVDTTADGFAGAILFLNPPADTDWPSLLIMRNNIFYLQNFDNVVRGLPAGKDFVHTNNIYYLPSGRLGNNFYLHSSEIQGNPQFKNISAGDFTLSSSSPAINHGLDLGYTFDFNGMTVPVGSAPDLGSYEYPVVIQ